MNIDTPNFEARETQIAILHAVVAKNDAAIEATRLTLARMETKQINRRAELRCQLLMFARAQRLAAHDTE